MFIIMQSSKCNFVFILFPPICSTATDFDCILHVNPRIENRGLAMVFNPPGSTLSWNLCEAQRAQRLQYARLVLPLQDQQDRDTTRTSSACRTGRTSPSAASPCTMTPSTSSPPRSGCRSPWWTTMVGGTAPHLSPSPSTCWSTSGRWPIYHCIPVYTDKFVMWCVSIRVRSCIFTVLQM